MCNLHPIEDNRRGWKGGRFMTALWPKNGAITFPPSEESSFNGNKNLKFQQRDAFRPNFLWIQPNKIAILRKVWYHDLASSRRYDYF